MKYVATKETGIFDLFITFGTGSKTPVKLQKGDLLPTDAIDSRDLEKSLKFGGLGRLIANGTIVKVEDKDADKAVNTVSAAPKLPSEVEVKKVAELTKKPYSNVEVADLSATETKREDGMTEIIKTHSSDGSSVPVDMVHFEQATGTDKSGGTIAVQVELAKTDPRNPEGEKPQGIDGYDTKVDFASVKNFKSFSEMNHYDQLMYAKQCTDKGLLNEIVQNSSKKQIQNNCKKRLEELK